MAGPVVGGEELRRAFVAAGGNFSGEMQKRLRYFARPVEIDAEALALGRIRRIGPAWFQMRIGSAPKSVYIAPVQRGTRIPKRRRPKFSTLLITVAMEPALDKNRERIANDIATLVDRMERKWGGA